MFIYFLVQRTWCPCFPKKNSNFDSMTTEQFFTLTHHLNVWEKMAAFLDRVHIWLLLCLCSNFHDESRLLLLQCCLWESQVSSIDFRPGLLSTEISPDSQNPFIIFFTVGKSLFSVICRKVIVKLSQNL